MTVHEQQPQVFCSLVSVLRRSLFQGAETVGFLRKPNALGFFFASLRKTLCAAEDASALPLASGNADARRGCPAPQPALSDAAAPVMHGKRTAYREK